MLTSWAIRNSLKLASCRDLLDLLTNLNIKTILFREKKLLLTIGNNMRCIRLYGSGSATANNVANVTIPSATRILGVQWSAYANSITDDAIATWEISQASATEIAVNGSQQAIVEIRTYNNLLTSGMTLNHLNGFFPVDVSVKQGQIIYLHAVISGTLGYAFNGLIWLRD